jgi:hypothetical protein
MTRDNVVTLPTRATADAAWARYQGFAQRLIDDPRLSLDRGFMEQMHLADRAWREAFDRTARRA